MLANASLGSSSRQKCQSTWRSHSCPRKQPGRPRGPLHGSTRPSGISFARWMSVGGLGASTPRIRSFLGGPVPQPASLQRHLTCVLGSCSSDHAGSELRFGAIRLLPESNATVRMLQKLFSLSLSPLFFSSHNRGGRSEAAAAWVLQVPWAAWSHAPRPTHSASSPQTGFISSGRGEVKARWFYQVNTDR